VTPQALLSSLVNVASVTDSRIARVVPGDAQASLLVRKVSGDFSGLACAPSACGARMPFGGPPLPSASVETLRRWVDAGAQLN
jgi:hypothetical protein